METPPSPPPPPVLSASMTLALTPLVSMAPEFFTVTVPASSPLPPKPPSETLMFCERCPTETLALPPAR